MKKYFIPLTAFLLLLLAGLAKGAQGDLVIITDGNGTTSANRTTAAALPITLGGTGGTNATQALENLGWSVGGFAAGGFDWATDSHFALTLSGNTNIAFNNVVPGKTVTISLTGAGGYGVNWPTGITWLTGTPPNPTAGQTVTYRFTATGPTTFTGTTEAQSTAPLPISAGGTGGGNATAARSALSAAGLGDNNTFSGANVFNGTTTLGGNVTFGNATFNSNTTLGDAAADDTTINDDDPRFPNLTSATYAAAADDKVALNGNVGDARYGAIIFRTKSSDTSRASTATATADPDLKFPYTAGTWQVDIYVRVNAGATGGYRFFASGGLSVNAFGEHTLTNRSTFAQKQALPDDVITDAGYTTALYTARVIFTATGSGTYSLNWAQSVSDAANTTIIAGSTLVARKIN